jgi:hypothetical protein
MHRGERVSGASEDKYSASSLLFRLVRKGVLPGAVGTEKRHYTPCFAASSVSKAAVSCIAREPKTCACTRVFPHKKPGRAKRATQPNLWVKRTDVRANARQTPKWCFGPAPEESNFNTPAPTLPDETGNYRLPLPGITKLL